MQRQTKTKATSDPQLISMFNKMVGVESPELEIVLPKYQQLLASTQTIIKVLRSFVKSPAAGVYASVGQSIEPVVGFIDMLQAFIERYQLVEADSRDVPADIVELAKSDPNILTAYALSLESQYKGGAQIAGNYLVIKKCAEMQSMILTYRNLRQLVGMFEKQAGAKIFDVNTGNLDFIVQAEGITVKIFEFAPDLDFKNAIVQGKFTDELQKYMWNVFRLLNNNMKTIADIITSPDVDASKMSHIIRDALGRMKSNIPGCDDAFKLIDNSENLFTENFSGYYRDFVSSGSPSIIIENFVSDVAKRQSKNNRKVMSQFAKIIQTYKANIQGKANVDPGLKHLLDLACENLEASQQADKSPAAAAAAPIKNSKRNLIPRYEDEAPAGMTNAIILPSAAAAEPAVESDKK